jgi:hypothetical protein
MKNVVLHGLAVVTIMLAFTSSVAFANEEAGHHEYPHHHIAIFAGGGFERDGNHEENGAALGLEYEVQWSEKERSHFLSGSIPLECTSGLT